MVSCSRISSGTVLSLPNNTGTGGRLFKECQFLQREIETKAKINTENTEQKIWCYENSLSPSCSDPLSDSRMVLPLITVGHESWLTYPSEK